MQIVQKFTRILTTGPTSVVTNVATLFNTTSHSAIIPQAGMSGVLTLFHYQLTVEYIENLKCDPLQYKVGDPEIVYVYPIRLEVGRTIALFIRGHHRLATIKKIEKRSVQPSSAQESVAVPRIATQYFDNEDIMTAVMDQSNETVNVHPRSTTRMIPREELDQGPDYARMNLVAFFCPPQESAGTSEHVAVNNVSGLAQDGNGSAAAASTRHRRKPVPLLDPSLDSSQNDDSASRDSSDGGIADFTHPTASSRNGATLPRLECHPSYNTSNSSSEQPRRQWSAQNNSPAVSSDVAHPEEGFPYSTSTSTRTSSSASADLAQHAVQLPTVITDDNDDWRGDFDSSTIPLLMDWAASYESGAIIAPQGSSPRNLSPVSSLELPKPLSRQISRKLSMRKPLPSLPEHSAAVQLGIDDRRGGQDLQRPYESTRTSGVVKASSNPSIRRVALNPERKSFKSDMRQSAEVHQRRLDKGKDRARLETASETLIPPIVPKSHKRVSGEYELKAVSAARNTVPSRAYAGGTMEADGTKRAASSGPSRIASTGRTVGEPF